MGFFSALRLFYPGRPPEITVGQLRAFSDQLRNTIAFKPWIQGVRLKYGTSISGDVESTNLFKEIMPNMWQSVSDEWDHEVLKRDCRWCELWPPPKLDSQSVYRAHITFGGLPTEICREFESIDQTDNTCGIVPDMASLSIEPFSPATLSDEDERDIISWFSFGFAGNGYFSWRKDPFDAYWQEVREKPTLRSVLQICRECFPVPALSYLDEMTADLGPLFMNRDKYKEGDWIVTVSESG